MSILYFIIVKLVEIKYKLTSIVIITICSTIIASFIKWRIVFQFITFVTIFILHLFIFVLDLLNNSFKLIITEVKHFIIEFFGFQYLEVPII